MVRRIYMHEYITITGANRAKYFEHMTSGWRQGAHERRHKTFGVWGTLGSTGHWPQVVNLWEYEGGWEHLAESFDHESSGAAMQDPFLQKWWLEAQPLRSGGYDRLLIPADFSPSVDETIARGVVGYRVFRHETVRTLPGQARRYLDRLGTQWAPKAREFGMELIGAYRTALRDDTEVLLIWAIADWSTWAQAEQQVDDGAGRSWRDATRDIAPAQDVHLMCSAPLSPLQTGAQP
jgi:hypothetical protein